MTETPTEIIVPETSDHGVRGHHKYGMSKLPALGECSGYQSNSGNSKASEEGTMLHEILDDVVKFIKTTEKPGPHPFTGWDLECLCETTRHVITARKLDELIDENTFWLLRYCLAELEKWLPLTTIIHNEINVQILKPDGGELNHGHLDLLLEMPGNKGILIDWKFGWIPVAPAEINYQGKGYGLGSFMKFPHLTKIGVKFVQPKLHRTTQTILTRDEIPALYEAISGIINRAQFGPHELRPNPYCDFCAAATTCPALVQNGALVVQKVDELPFLDVISSGVAKTPEEVVVAAFMVSRLEKILADSPFRSQALELATAAGGKLEVAFGGRIITVEAKEKNSSRTANSPGMIIEVLTPQVGAESALDIVMNACEPSVGKLEENYADVITRLRSEEADKFLTTAMDELNAKSQQAQATLDADLANDTRQAVVQAESAAEQKEKTKALKDAYKVAVKALKDETKAAAAAIKAQVKEIKVTKKDAIAHLGSVLESGGLVTRPDARIRYAQIRCEKQISEAPALEPAVSGVLENAVTEEA